MILVDANVLMYAAGAPHEHEDASVRFLEDVAAAHVEAVIDAEILQEILHRYRALDRWADGRRLYDLTRTLFPVVLPITVDVLDRARAILDEVPHIMARDALHAAVVVVNGLEAICSFDRDFDAVRSVKRIVPE